MKKLKSNYYNALVPVPEENEYLLFNTLSGGLEVLPWETGKLLEALETKDSGDFEESDESISYLMENKYLLDYNDDPRSKYFDFLTEKRKQLFQPQESATMSITITTTITCNMGCAYCYEAVKPNKTLRSESNIEGIVAYLEDMAMNAPVKKWTHFSLTWYGGEPLINTKAIEKLTPRILEMCDKYGMTYSASIVTNGILLEKDTWKILVDNHVNQVQVTIDGSKETHDKYRPLKNSSAKNYDRILQNLTHIPDDVSLTIRVNTDKEVAKVFPQLLDDLQSNGIWPQKHGQVKIYPALLEVFAEANEADTNSRYSNDEYFPVYQGLRQLIMSRYDQWAINNNKSKGRLGWNLPSFQQECNTWVSPYSVVIDPEGNIQKCWNTIHDEKFNISHVSQGWKMDSFKQHMAFDRSTFHPICSECKFLPVCTSLSCNYEAIKAVKPACTHWKSHLGSALREQYLFMKSNPEQMKLPNERSVLKDLSC